MIYCIFVYYHLLHFFHYHLLPFITVFITSFITIHNLGIFVTIHSICYNLLFFLFHLFHLLLLQLVNVEGTGKDPQDDSKSLRRGLVAACSPKMICRHQP